MKVVIIKLLASLIRQMIKMIIPYMINIVKNIKNYYTDKRNVFLQKLNNVLSLKYFSLKVYEKRFLLDMKSLICIWWSKQMYSWNSRIRQKI